MFLSWSMNEIIKKIEKVYEAINSERTGTRLFALFHRTDIDNKWDLVISARWFSNDKRKDLIYVIEKLKERLTENDIEILDRIELIRPSGKFVTDIIKSAGPISEPKEFRDLSIGDIRFDDVWIFMTSSN